MNLNTLINLPWFGDAAQKLKDSSLWNYEYPDWFIQRVQDITKVELTEEQRRDLRDVYEQLLEGY